MLLVQLTDIHLMASPEQTLRGVNTQETLEKVLQAIANSDQKPDLFLLTGDLADAGDGEAYQRLRSAITPMGIPTYALMGNHDLRDHLCQHLINDLIHYQQQIILDNWQILCLDSTVAGQIGGHLSQETLNWLEQTLNTSQLPTLIALHHPPVLLESAWIDSMGLANREDFWAVCQRFPHVKVVLCGHAHQRADLRQREIDCFVTPSTCMQFLPKSAEFAIDSDGRPAWRWLELKNDGSYATGVGFC